MKASKLLKSWPMDDYYFDYAIALWYWCSHWHEGQFSEKYSIMSTMPLRNCPSIQFEDDNGVKIYTTDEVNGDEDETIRQIYHELNEDNHLGISKALNKRLENMD